MNCVNVMPADIDVSICFIITGQRRSESDLCISMSCVNSVSDDIDISRCCILARQGPSDNDLRVSNMYLFLYLVNNLMTKP